jgi:hypothetical protein
MKKRGFPARGNTRLFELETSLQMINSIILICNLMRPNIVKKKAESAKRGLIQQLFPTPEEEGA